MPLYSFGDYTMKQLNEFVESWINQKTGYVIELWMTENGKPYLISQHIRVFYQENGRRPKKGYDLHHIDGDKTNNAIENIIELEKSKHRILHRIKEDGHFYD